MLPSTPDDLVEPGLLLGDPRLRLGDLLVERGLAILRRPVVLVELCQPAVEVVELIGDLIDLGLLVTDAAGADAWRESNRLPTAMAAATDR